MFSRKTFCQKTGSCPNCDSGVQYTIFSGNLITFAPSKGKILIDHDHSRPTKGRVGARAGAEGVSLTSMPKSFNWKRKSYVPMHLNSGTTPSRPNAK
jgi:hypothetical protein